MSAFLLSLVLLSGALEAQELPPAPPPASVEIGNFTEGLHSRNAANSIPDGALSEALNVLIDEDAPGVIVRRQGATRCAVNAMTGTKKVRGVWAFKAPDGTKYHVALSSETFFQHDGDCDWAAITGFTNFAQTSDADCVGYLGKFWCIGDGEPLAYWDPSGTPSTHVVAGAPAGSILDGHRNRIIVADVDSNQSRLYLSAELDGTAWTVPSILASSSPAIIPIGGVNDGDKIRCLMGTKQDVYEIGTENRLYGLYGFDNRDFKVRELSREVGCIDDKTVKEKNNGLYWLSKRGIERQRGSTTERISDPIRDITDLIISAAGNLRTFLDDTQTDFEAGNLVASGAGAPISATISPGSIVGSTWTVVETSSTNWSSGTLSVGISTGDVIGDIRLSSTTFEDNFSDNAFRSGTNVSGPVWTEQVAVGHWSSLFDSDLGGNVLKNDVGGSEIEVNQTVSTGAFRMRFKHVTDSVVNRFFFMLNGNNTGSSTGYRLEAADSTSGSPETLTFTIKENPSGDLILSSAVVRGAETVVHSVEIRRSTDGIFALYYSSSGFSNLVFTSSGTDATYNTSTRMILLGTGNNCMRVTDIYFVAHSTFGRREGPLFNIGLSTPIGGPVSVSSSITTSGQAISLEYRDSASAAGPFSAWASQPIDSKLLCDSQYCQLAQNLSTNEPWKTPSIQDQTLSAGTTGYFVSQCRNPGAVITSWGRLTCDQDAFDGSWVLQVATAASCGNVIASSAPWTTMTNDTVISVPTAPFVAYRLLNGFSVFYTTGNPINRSCQIEWNEGEARPPLAAEVYLDRYHLAYTTSTASGAKNDHILVLDSDDKWVLWDNLNCYSLGLYERNLYCGSSTDNGLVYRLYNGTSDDGTAFTSRFKTKAYAFGGPHLRKEYLRFGAELEPEPEASYDISTVFRYYLDRGATPIAFDEIDMGEDAGHLLWADIPFQENQSKTGRYIQLEGQVTGMNTPFRFYRGLLKYRPLREE